MICPHCGKDFPHNCSSEVGKLGAGKRTEKKSKSSAKNIRKALEKRWPDKPTQE